MRIIGVRPWRCHAPTINRDNRAHTIPFPQPFRANARSRVAAQITRETTSIHSLRLLSQPEKSGCDRSTRSDAIAKARKGSVCASLRGRVREGEYAAVAQGGKDAITLPHIVQPHLTQAHVASDCSVSGNHAPANRQHCVTIGRGVGVRRHDVVAMTCT